MLDTALPRLRAALSLDERYRLDPARIHCLQARAGHYDAASITAVANRFATLPLRIRWLVRGVGELASHVFGVAISRPTLVKNGAPSYLDDPRYCTAIGLIRYAQILDAELPQQRSWLGRMLGFFGKKNS